MIRLRLTEMLADKSFLDGRRVEWREVAEATGIHRTTLSKMANQRGYNATCANLDLLCVYFRCPLSDLAVHVPDSELEQPVGQSFKGPRPAASRKLAAPVLPCDVDAGMAVQTSRPAGTAASIGKSVAARRRSVPPGR